MEDMMETAAASLNTGSVARWVLGTRPRMTVARMTVARMTVARMTVARMTVAGVARLIAAAIQAV
jgi:hypothetical protein